MSPILNKAKEIADHIKKQKNILIITHIDADGIAAGSIASSALKRKGIDHKVRFVKKLDENEIDRIKNDNPKLVWFTDLGSGVPAADNTCNQFEFI